MNAQTISRTGFTPRQIGWSAAAALLLAPAIAMVFTREMNWGAEDFAALALMIGVAGLMAEAGVRVFRKPLHRFALAGGIGLASLLVWAELAVGLLPA